MNSSEIMRKVFKKHNKKEKLLINNPTTIYDIKRGKVVGSVSLKLKKLQRTF